MRSTQPYIPGKWLYLFIAIAVFINFSALFVPIQGPDAALYALISKTMVQRNDFVNLIYHGHDWLDKPHFPFWITALSFKIFGINTWAYKLPGILFLMMGAWYTYLLGRDLYNRQIGLLSALILLTAQHIVLSNNDVRAEPYLTGLIIAAVYYFYQAHIYKTYWPVLIGSVFAACAVMTKGIFAIVPIGGAFAGQFIITRQWKQLFNIRWLVAILLTFIFIVPELWCLHQQFDIHPEKIVFGHTGVSGIRFFFWDSQFGRFFNTGPIKGGGDPSFFLHTALWAFLPWSLLMFAAVFQQVKKGIKNVKLVEWYCISAALLTFLLFSASKFQLPHYLNIVFPFFAILTAQYLYYIVTETTAKTIEITQAGIIVLLLSILGLLHYFFRPDFFSWFTCGTILMLMILLVFAPGVIINERMQKTIIRTVLISFIVNLYLNLSFYPSLLRYQAGSEAAVWINTHNMQQLPVAQLNEDVTAPFEFYIAQPLIPASAVTQLQGSDKPFIIYGDADKVSELAAQGWRLQTLATFKQYWITRLSATFLNKNTREKTLTDMVVVKVN